MGSECSAHELAGRRSARALTTLSLVASSARNITAAAEGPPVIQQLMESSCLVALAKYGGLTKTYLNIANFYAAIATVIASVTVITKVLI